MQDGEVWAPDAKEGFIKGQVIEIGSDNLTVQSVDNEFVVAPYSKVFPTATELLVDDNCSLLQLNEASLLDNIRQRYKKDKIYTYTANILTVVNPYKDMPGLYTQATATSYKGTSLGKLAPHTYAIADKAYRDMKQKGTSQSVIVSGESGAGKTETTKHFIKYLATVYGKGTNDGIEDKFIQANPLLEAFGNAQTVRNKNSSRFGKFVEIKFNNKGDIVGGYVSTYLLEKSRITYQCANERNYHVFYRLIAGAPAKLKNLIQLKTVTDYECLEEGVFSSEMGDAANYKEIDNAMSCIGISNSDKLNIYKVVSAVLAFSNVHFVDSGDSRGGSKVSEESAQWIAITAQCLDLEPDDLRYALTSRMMQTKNLKKGTTYMVPLKKTEALQNRNGLCKALYTRLFDLIVQKINESLPLKEESSCYIGILDIAGFEYFEKNSFEQFCINYCNEKLQQFFNSRVIKEEQDLYTAEELGIGQIEFSDNQDCIELIENAIGYLDEEAKLPQGSNSHFTITLHDKNKNHFRLQAPRKSKLTLYRSMLNDEGFIIRHYAGAVCYNTEGWLNKNSDTLHSSLEQLMLTSGSSFVSGLFADVDDVKHSKKMKQDSIGGKFKKQLAVLLEKLNGTATSFIRCLKPNQHMKPLVFEGGKVLSQLNSLGMVTALELMQAGFPSRIAFQDLYDMYSKMLPEKLKSLHPRVFCSALFRAIGMSPNDYKFGVTKIFFRPGKFAEVDMLLTSGASHLTEMIGQVKKWIVHQRWRRVQYAVLVFNKSNNIKYDREKVLGEIEEMERGLTEELVSIKKGEVHSELIEEKGAEIELQIKQLLEKVKETQDMDRLRQIQEQMELERKRKEEEERLRKEEEARVAEERRIKKELEEQRKRELEEERLREEEQAKLKAEEDAKAAQRAKEEREEALRKEQEERDNSVNQQIKEDTGSTVAAEPKKAPLNDGVRDIKRMQEWTYSDLRDTINTEVDLEILAACREEFHRRLKAYQAWKTRNAQKWQKEESVKPDLQIATTPAMAAVPTTAEPMPEAKHRLFKVPFVYPSYKYNNPSIKGWWYAHFYGKWIVRQLEIHPEQAPLCLVAGKDDLRMCELSLQETGLTRRKGSEISLQEFEDLWSCCGGGAYSISNAKK